MVNVHIGESKTLPTRGLLRYHDHVLVVAIGLRQSARRGPAGKVNVMIKQ